MATKIIANSGTSAWKLQLRVTYSENGSGITITKVEGSRSETSGSETYDNDCNVLLNGAKLSTGAHFPIKSAWKVWWTGTKKLSTYTATFTFSNCSNNNIKNSKFVLSITATKHRIAYTKGTGVESFSGPTSVNHGATVTTKAVAADGYYLSHYTKTVGGSTSTATDCKGLKSHTRTFAAVTAATTFGCYASPYECTIVFHKNTGATTTYSETYTAGVSGQKFGKDISSTGGQFGDWDYTGYELLGWSKDATSTTAEYAVHEAVSNAFIEKYNEGLHLYAVWKLKTYKLIYDANGGSGAPAAQNRTIESTIIISSTKPTRDNYAFMGWSGSKTATSASYQGGEHFSSKTAADITLYAVWEKKLHIAFHRNHSASDTTIYNEYYRKSGKDNYFGKDTDGNGQFGAWDYSGYKLLGWSTNRNATSATYGINHFITDAEFESWWSDITLYAVWRPDYIYIKRGGAWKPGEVYIKVNGAWKQGRPYIKKSSTWMQ